MNGEGTDVIGAETRSERNTKRGGVTTGGALPVEGRFKGRVIGVENEERGWLSARGVRVEDGDGMRGGGRK